MACSFCGENGSQIDKIDDTILEQIKLYGFFPIQFDSSFEKSCENCKTAFTRIVQIDKYVKQKAQE